MHLPSRRTVMSQPTARRYRSPSGRPPPTSRRGKPKAVILGLHGFGDYRKAWDEPAEIWAKDGITTYSYDQRGFGSSPTRGRWPGTEPLVDDAKTMISAAARPLSRCAGLSCREKHRWRVALVAEDQGAQTDGLILLATAAALARHVRSGGDRRPVVLRPYHPVVSIRADLDRLQADRQSQDAGEAAQRSADAAPDAARHGLWAGRPDGCRARGRRRASMSLA